jgi:hypothetical protein
MMLISLFFDFKKHKFGEQAAKTNEDFYKDYSQKLEKELKSLKLQNNTVNFVCIHFLIADSERGKSFDRKNGKNPCFRETKFRFED